MLPKGIEPTRARFARFLTSLAGGVKIAKVVIAPQRDAHLFRKLGQSIWCLFVWDLRPSRAAMSPASASGNVDALG